MSWFLGGMTVTNAGWAGAQSVYVDFVSEYDSGWLWQLYANRTLIGHTEHPGDRRIYGQLVAADVPAPLTLVRVSSGDVLTDYGPELPRLPWNRFALAWDAATDPDVDTDHFDLTAGTEAGGEVDADNVLARIPFNGVGAYRFELPPLATGGEWKYAITPRDDALPLGNAGTVSEVTIDALVPPPDVQFDEDGNRFTLSAAGGVVTASFAY